MTRVEFWWLVFLTFLVGFLVVWNAECVRAHEIYTNLHGKDGQLCCGGSDCAVTHYRESGDRYEFETRNKKWVAIPQDRITFLPVPGDPSAEDGDEAHKAHLCYRPATPSDSTGPFADKVFGDIFLYCAFIPPGAI